MQAQVQDSVQMQQPIAPVLLDGTQQQILQVSPNLMQTPQASSDLAQPLQNNNFQQGSDNERALKDVKRGAQQIAGQLKQFEALVARFEEKGVAISSDIKTKIEELKTITNKFLSATADDVKISI